MSDSSSESSGLTPLERRAVAGLGTIVSVRILGLFLLLPVLALYAADLPGATPAKLGLAVGAYGLTQALLQIPFGHLSDRFGRKPVILLGLVLFGVGSVVAALAQTVEGVILGRTLQGAGAVSAAVTALLADLTRDRQRTRAMAFIGAGIGLAFVLSIVLGPVLAALVGVQGIFWLTAVMAALAMLVLVSLVPQPAKKRPGPRQPWGPDLLLALREPELVTHYLGIFLLHWLITALFVVVPFVLQDQLQLPQADHWLIYLISVLVSLMGTVALILASERMKNGGGLLTLATGLLALAYGLLMLLPPHIVGVGLALALFFTGTNFLEAKLPARVSQLAPVSVRGAALGIYATSQFLGAFLGGWMAGWISGRWGDTWVFLCAVILALIWTITTRTAGLAPRSVSG